MPFTLPPVPPVPPVSPVSPVSPVPPRSPVSPSSPLSRRAFLARSAGGAAVLVSPRLFAADARPVDEHTVALLADTHIAANAGAVVREAHMAGNLARAGKELLSREKRPIATVINGDCALTDGKPGDYATLVGLVEPLREAGLSVAMTLGNHDDRDNFRQGVKQRGRSALEAKHAMVIPTPRANLVLLDSLDKVNVTPGQLGEAQLKWLGDTLDKHADKPAIVIAHHTPDKGKPDTKFGLMDTDAMLEVLSQRKHVKAYIYGHSHNWRVHKEGDLHMVNLPPVAYVFNKARPNGWVEMSLMDGGAMLKLHALDKEHEEHGRKVELAWR